jgi:hypothetical protein
MPKILNILTSILTEASRFKMDPELNFYIQDLADRLWSMRDKKFTRKTLVDGFPFKTSDGVDGYVKVIINPRLPYLGYMDTNPKESRDPMDFVMELQPKEYVSRRNLYLTIYHEMLHATDPSQSTKFSPKYSLTYDEKSDEKYWGHPIEFRAISNEFLEGLELEMDRRTLMLKNPENKKYLVQSLDNILNYFSNGEKLSKLSLDILRRVNDEEVLENRISKSISDIASENPRLSDFISEREGNEPYYLTYVELIKKHNPKIWPRFLTMLYKSIEDTKSKINIKGV